MSEGRDLATKREWLANVKRRKCRQNRCRPSHVCEGISSGGGRWLVKCKLVLMPSKANYRIIPPPPLVCSFTGTRQGRWRDLATIKKRNWHTVPLQNKGTKRRERPRFCSNLEFALSFNRELGNLSVSCSKLCRIWVVGGRGSSIMRRGIRLEFLRVSQRFRILWGFWNFKFTLRRIFKFFFLFFFRNLSIFQLNLRIRNLLISANHRVSNLAIIESKNLYKIFDSLNFRSLENV